MPTFNDPAADAREAAEAMRGLAHATQRVDQPAQMYAVIGDLQATARSLQQVLDQLAHAHMAHLERATNDLGDYQIGSADAFATADALGDTASFIDQAHERLNQAQSHAGRIAWQPADEQQRWLNVVFLQGDQATESLDLVENDGPEAAIAHLRGYDYGDETTDAALSNGYVYARLPEGNLDRTVTSDGYALTYNPAMSHVSLYRAFTPDPENALPETGRASLTSPIASRPAATRRSVNPPTRDASWFEHPGVAAVKQARGLSR